MWAHAQRHVSQHMVSNRKFQEKSQIALAKFVSCLYLKKNACTENKTHETKGVLYRHICSSCWVADNKAYGHSQVDGRTGGELAQKMSMSGHVI